MYKLFGNNYIKYNSYNNNLKYNLINKNNISGYYDDLIESEIIFKNTDNFNILSRVSYIQHVENFYIKIINQSKYNP